MSERHGRTERDRRRRTLGQNFLVDGNLIRRFLDDLELRPGQLVVDIGAGSGALTLAMAEYGADVWAIEPDRVWADQLTAAVHRAGRHDQVRVIPTDVERLRLPRVDYRVVANPPFGLTTRILSLLLDDPRRGPARADLVLQREVAEKHAATPPTALRTAAWTPWWTFQLGITIDRSSFRPRPSVDATVLRIDRRDPAVLPPRLAHHFIETLRPAWTTAPGSSTRHTARS